MIVAVFPNMQVLDLARSYHEAAEVLAATDTNAIPIINLRCHAIELFLKSLHLKDVATDIGGEVSLIRPIVGRCIRHDLEDSFSKALQDHRDELTSSMPSLNDDLRNLEGVFQKSRYLYENGESLPLATAERVSQYLAKKVPGLRRLTDGDD